MAAVLVNITNHRSSDWSESETKAAGALASKIVDVPFPSVPPGADLPFVEALAAETVAKVPTTATHAVVAGEFTLVVCLLRLLQQRRIRCMSATTHRSVSKLDDGTTSSKFEFVRFRDYPRVYVCEVSGDSEDRCSTKQK